MKRFGRLTNYIKNLSPAFIREIIAVLIILCLSVVLSLPQYNRDKEAAKLQNEMQKNDKSVPAAKPEAHGKDSGRLKAGVDYMKSLQP
jgi:hypothetical protein